MAVVANTLPNLLPGTYFTYFSRNADLATRLRPLADAIEHSDSMQIITRLDAQNDLDADWDEEDGSGSGSDSEMDALG